jgi:DNA-directed RNA polymerase alpha subunit
MEVSILFNLSLLIERAFVKNVRNCTTCRECIRPEKFKDIIDLGKIKDRFEFHVESVGIYTP